MAVDEKRPLSFSDVSATMLITLYARALETETPHPILVDEKAVELRQALNPLLAQAEEKLYRELAQDDLPTMFRKLQWVVHYRLNSPDSNFFP